MTALTLDYLTNDDFRELARILRRIHARAAARRAQALHPTQSHTQQAGTECRIGGPSRGDTQPT